MRANLWSMRTWLRLSFLLALPLVSGCGGSDETAVPGDGQSPQEVLHQLRPLSTAQVTAVRARRSTTRPRRSGTRSCCASRGRCATTAPDKLPSLDWKISFTGFNDQFSSRVVSTGSDVFVHLGGADFSLGEAAVARMVDQARQAQVAAGPASRRSASTRSRRSEASRRRAPAPSREKVTRYTGTVDRGQLFDQLERLFRGIPNPGGAPTVITPEQRAELESMFAAPQFELDVAADQTVRRIVITDRFRTLVANRKAAGGITGGKLSLRGDVRAAAQHAADHPPAHSEPLGELPHRAPARAPAK